MANELEKLYNQLSLVNIRLRGIEDDINLKAKEGESFFRRKKEIEKKIQEFE